MRQQRGIARRNIEIHGRRHFTQVAYALPDQRRQRLAPVDVERAGMAQHQVEVMIAAERVVPRQPIDQDQGLLGEKRPDLRDLLLISRQHSVGIDHALGQAGRS